MSTLTVRDVPQSVHDELRQLAAENRSSVEAEARRALAEHVGRQRSPERLKRRLRAIQATLPSPPEGARISGVEAFLAGKRLEALFEEGLISLSEKLAWETRLDRYEASLDEVEALFDRLWPWPSPST